MNVAVAVWLIAAAQITLVVLMAAIVLRVTKHEAEKTDIIRQLGESNRVIAEQIVGMAEDLARTRKEISEMTYAEALEIVEGLESDKPTGAGPFPEFCQRVCDAKAAIGCYDDPVPYPDLCARLAVLEEEFGCDCQAPSNP